MGNVSITVSSCKLSIIIMILDLAHASSADDIGWVAQLIVIYHQQSVDLLAHVDPAKALDWIRGVHCDKAECLASAASLHMTQPE